MKIDELKTGDILLFDEFPNNSCFECFTSCIKKCTRSKYSHCAYVVKNRMKLPRDQVWLWESSYHKGTEDPKDHKKNKFGVQFTPLSYYTEHYPGRVDIYVRSRQTTNINPVCKNKLSSIRKAVYGKPYDINVCDWIMAKLRCGPRETTKKFWCSALVAFILIRVGDIEHCDWSGVRAQDLSSSAAQGPLCWTTQYDDDEKLETECC